MFKMRPPGKSGLAAGLLGLVFAAATLLWLRLDRAPPNWDDAWYLTNSLTVYDALTQGGLPRLSGETEFRVGLQGASHRGAAGSVLSVARAPLARCIPGEHRIHVGALRRPVPDRAALVERASGGFRHRDRRHHAAALRLGTVVHGGVCPHCAGGCGDLRTHRVGRAETGQAHRALRRLVRLRLAVEGQLPAVCPARAGLRLVHVGAPGTAAAMDCAAMRVAGAPLVCRASAADAGECARCGFRCACGNSGHRPHLLDAHDFDVPFACRVDWRLVLLRRACAVGGLGPGDSTQWKDSVRRC